MIIGIMGGMGPEATIDLYAKIIEATRERGASEDQDHLEVVISSVPQTPDRTKAIFGSGPSPEPELIRSARRLEAAGAGLVAIACNSAHHFLKAIQSAVEIPVLDVMLETARHIADLHPEARKVGVLATDGTLRARLYHNALERAGLEPLIPDSEGQKLLMAAIYGDEGIKKRSVTPATAKMLESVADGLVQRGAEIIIAGCTEIPLGLRPESLSVPLVDATRVLAEAAVERALLGTAR